MSWLLKHWEKIVFLSFDEMRNLGQNENFSLEFRGLKELFDTQIQITSSDDDHVFHADECLRQTIAEEQDKCKI